MEESAVGSVGINEIIVKNPFPRDLPGGAHQGQDGRAETTIARKPGFRPAWRKMQKVPRARHLSEGWIYKKRRKVDSTRVGEDDEWARSEEQ